ncbi:hypothetical protein ACP70R_014593 [Stipagrostis hirtigluma subsp. patula]
MSSNFTVWMSAESSGGNESEYRTVFPLAHFRFARYRAPGLRIRVESPPPRISSPPPCFGAPAPAPGAASAPPSRRVAPPLRRPPPRLRARALTFRAGPCLHGLPQVRPRLRSTSTWVLACLLVGRRLHAGRLGPRLLAGSLGSDGLEVPLPCSTALLHHRRGRVS